MDGTKLREDGPLHDAWLAGGGEDDDFDFDFDFEAALAEGAAASAGEWANILRASHKAHPTVPPAKGCGGADLGWPLLVSHSLSLSIRSRTDRSAPRRKKPGAGAG